MRTPRKVPGEPSWFWRRTVLFIVVAFCMVQLWRLVGVADSEVHETLGWGHIMLLAALVLGYQGFATAQDIAAIMATKSGTPYQPPIYGDPRFDPSGPYEDEQRPPGAGIR